MTDSTLNQADVTDILATARRLRDDVLDPAEKELDRTPITDEVTAHPTYISALSRAGDIGIDRLGLSEDLGGISAPLELSLKAAEVVADGAPGFASMLLSGELLSRAVLGLPEIQHLATSRSGTGGTGKTTLSHLAWTVFQPDGGAESIGLPASGLDFRSARHRTDPLGLGSVTAEGTAVRFRNVRLPSVANGDRCSTLLLFLGPIAGVRPAATYSLALEETAGVSRVRTPRMGLRTHGQGEIILEDVLLQDADVVLESEGSVEFLENLLTLSNLGMTALALGLSNRSYEYAKGYCQTRVQGGKPIIEHQSLAWILWRANSSIQVVRGALASSMLADPAGLDLARAIALRTVAAEMVSRVTIEMLELLGGYGITADYPMEKYFRDACAMGIPTGLVEGNGMDAPVTLL